MFQKLARIEKSIQNKFATRQARKEAKKQAIKKIDSMDLEALQTLLNKKTVDSDKVTEATEQIQESTQTIYLVDGTYFVKSQNVIPCRKALKENGLSELCIVQKTNGVDYAIYPRKDKNGKTKIRTDEWNRKLQACKEVMSFVKNGKPTSFNRGKRQFA